MVVNSSKEIYSFGDLLRDCWAFLEGSRGKFAFYFIVLFISQGGPFLLSYLLGSMVDFFTKYHSGDSLRYFYLLVFLIALVGVVQTYLRTYGKLEIGQLGASIRKKARLLAISKLLSFDLSWHEGESAGEKIQKINKGGDNLYSVFSVFANSGMVIIGGLALSIILFFLADWKYFLFSITYTFFFFLGERKYSREKAYWQEKMDLIVEKSSGQVHESTSNVLTVKAMGLRSNLEKSSKNYEDEYLETFSKSKQSSWRKTRFTRIMDALGYGLFILMLGLQTSRGLITVGSILVFTGYFARFRSAIDEVSGNMDSFSGLKSGVGRLMTIIGRESIDLESSDRVSISSDWKNITFRNVSFSYKDKLVIENFNLVINRGEKIGLVGRSGCGKSTIIKLLLGLYSVTKGEILIDSVNINRVKNSSLMSVTSVVLQDSEMFNQSLKENIQISSDNNNKSLFSRALSISEVNDLVKKLPNGVDTVIGEKGYKVSGGERQRIGIARALYKGSDLLILDEATSHLDSKTEMLIQEGLESLNEKTMIIIAHRLSTLRNVDRIIVMDKGKIIEEGKFNDLIRKKGLFSQMYKIQQRQKN